MRPPGRRRPPAVPLGIVLIDHPIQYVAPGLRRLAEQSGIRTRTYYRRALLNGFHDPGFDRWVRWKTDLHSGYDWWAPPERPGWQSALAVARQLHRDRPDVLLSFGWTSLVARVAFLYALLTRTPVLFFSDANIRTPRPPTWRNRLRRRLLRAGFRRAAGALTVGAANHAFYVAHDIPAQRLYPGVFCAEVDRFVAAAARRHDAGTPGTDRPFVIGFVGKLIGLKAVDDLVEACAALGLDRRWELWLVGDGPLRDEITALVARRGLTDRVRLFGFRNTDEVPDLVAAMDVLVLPSRSEQRGLAALEALAAGVPAVVSSVTGVWGPGDVIEPGVSGLVYPVGDIDALAGCLRRLMDDPAFRRGLAAEGRERAARLGAEGFGASVAAALRTVAANGRRPVPRPATKEPAQPSVER
ncbi:glycosyltransferase [Plantactinospora siamensis]|uniref:Glycosyltransferase n=1 Tax=Plantactinospora siamensis TaxID=555372 RepID=A0ABV6P0N0_9ACTN